MKRDKLQLAALVTHLEEAELRNDLADPGPPPRSQTFLVCEKSARCARNVNLVDEREWRVARHVQKEMLMHIGHVCHAALTRQPDGPPGGALHLDRVRPSEPIDLSGCDHLVADLAALVVTVISAVTGRIRGGGLVVECLAE